jgi:hypothetical protein
VTVATPELRVDCPDDRKFAVVAAVTAAMRARPDVVEVIDLDGVRARFADGWGLCRASNTQPALVLRCEAVTAARLSEIRTILEAAIAQAVARVTVIGVDLGGTNLRVAADRGRRGGGVGAARGRRGPGRRRRGRVDRGAGGRGRRRGPCGDRAGRCRGGRDARPIAAARWSTRPTSAGATWRSARRWRRGWGARHPLGVYNDVNAIAYGELGAGAGRGARDLLAVFVGTGLGAGWWSPTARWSRARATAPASSATSRWRGAGRGAVRLRRARLRRGLRRRRGAAGADPPRAGRRGEPGGRGRGRRRRRTRTSGTSTRRPTTTVGAGAVGRVRRLPRAGDRQRADRAQQRPAGAGRRRARARPAAARADWWPACPRSRRRRSCGR